MILASKRRTKSNGKKPRHHYYEKPRGMYEKIKHDYLGASLPHHGKHRIQKQKREKLERQKPLEKELNNGGEPKKKESWLVRILGKISPEGEAKAGKQAKEAEFELASIKSKNLEKCYKLLDNARNEINKGNASNAKGPYLEARSLYLGLEYHEKKQIYSELMDMYGRLIR